MSASVNKAVIDELDAGGRVLVSRLHYLGDVILSLPLVQALRHRFPNTKIDYLTRADGADVLTGEPDIDHVHRMPRSGGGVSVIKALRSRGYTVAFDLFSNPRSGLLTWLTGASVRIGGDRRGRRMYYTHPVSVPKSVRAATEHHMFFARALGIEQAPDKPTLHPSQSELAAAREKLRAAGVENPAQTIALHPGGKWEVKRWPAESFVELASRLRDERGVGILVMCGPGEEAYRDAVVAGVGKGCVALPIMPIRETAAVLAQFGAVVLADGGMMHASVAVGAPTVGIFGSSERDIWFPYENFGPYRAASVPISCRPCHQHTCSHISCLRNLSVDQVAGKVAEVMDGAL